MKIHYVIIGILVASMATWGSVLYMADLTQSYGATADTGSLNNTYAHLQETNNLTADLTNTINEFNLSTGPTALFSIPYQFFKTGWKVARIIFNTFGTVEAMIQDGSNAFAESTGQSFPSWFMSGIISIFFIIIAAIILYAFFKWKFED